MKLAKLSLAAIVAVGAMTTIASAQQLEEAIKGVEFSGFVEYNLNDVSKDPGVGEETINDWNFLGKLTAPVTEELKSTVVFASSSGSDTDLKDGTVTAKSGMDMDIRKAFLTYAQDGITVIAGLQDLKTPVTHNGFNGQKGEGVVGMYNMGQVTAAAAYFGNTSLSELDVAAAALIGSFDMFSARAWYVKIPEHTKSLYFLEGSASMAGASLTAQYISRKPDAVAAETGKFYAVKGAYSYEDFGVSATYTKNDEDQPIYALFNSGDTEVIGSGWRLQNSGSVFDLEKTWGIEGTYGFEKYGFKAGYAKGDKFTGVATNTDDIQEMYAGVSYKYSKNLSSYIQYSDVKDDAAANADFQYLRFNAKYSF